MLAKANFWDALVPIAMMFGTSLLNLAVLGPATTRVMRRRKHQGRLPSHHISSCERGMETDKLDRNERWQAVLRGGAQVRGDAKAEFVVYVLAQRGFAVESGGDRGDDPLWVCARGEDVKVSGDPNNLAIERKDVAACHASSSHIHHLYTLSN